MTKSPKKKTPTRSSARKAEKESLKDAEFSADEEDAAQLEKAAEANSKEEPAAEKEGEASKSGASCDAAVQFFDNLAKCFVMAIKMAINQRCPHIGFRHFCMLFNEILSMPYVNFYALNF